MPLRRGPKSNKGTGNLNVALALDLQQEAGGGFSLAALQCLGFVAVASQTPLVTAIPDPHSSKDEDSQKLPEEAGRDSSPCPCPDTRQRSSGRAATSSPL